MAIGGERYNQLEIFRPVEPSDELLRFLTAADAIAKLIFERNENVSIRVQDLVDEDEEVRAASLRAVSVTGHEIFRMSDLRVVLASYRSPRNIKGRQLQALYQRFDADLNPVTSFSTRQPAKVREPFLTREKLQRIALSHDNPFDTLEVSFDRLDPVSGISNGNKGRKFALMPKVTPESLQLGDEADFCLEAFSTNPQLRYPTQVGRPIPHIPFVRTPRGASEESIINFHEGLSEKLPVKINLGAVDVRYAT